MAQRTIAIGDIHGEFDELAHLLMSLDRTYDFFTGSGTVRDHTELVFMGDYIDRGEKGLKVLKLIQKLDRENDNVTLLAGNHEFMPFAVLEEVQSEIPNDSNLQARLDILDEHPGLLSTNGIGEFVKELGGFSNYHAYMQPGQPYDQFVRGLEPFALRTIGGKQIFFCHGGIPKEYTSMEQIHEYKDNFSRYMSVPFSDLSIREDFLGEKGFFQRRYKYTPAQDVHAQLDKLGIDYVVVGHDRTDSHCIEVMYDRIIHTDARMGSFGEPKALVIDDNGMHAHDAPYIMDHGAKLLSVPHAQSPHYPELIKF